MSTKGPEEEKIVVSVDNGIATVTLNRPQRLNALDPETFRILLAVADEMEERADVRTVVLTGAGRAFCSGADLVAFAEEIDTGNAHMVLDELRFVGRVVKRWTTLAKPTLAAVNGLAVGGGCNLALMCDLVLMHEDATIGETYVQRGLVVDMGGTYFLPRLVGRARANELALFGDSVAARDAERIGLVNRCVPAADWSATVDDWAARLAKGAGRAQRLIKTGLLASPLMDLDATLEWEASAISLVFQTADVHEAFAAFHEKREPSFEGR